MGRHRSMVPGTSGRVATPWLAVLAIVIALAGASAAAAVMIHDRHRQPGRSAEAMCDRAVRVVTSSSYAPVLAGVAPGLARAGDCVRVDVTVADGRAAAARVQQVGTDVWIPDDASWAATAPAALLAPRGTAGSGTVVATSPIYLVTDPGTARRIEQAGGSWRALARLVTTPSGVRLAVRDPSGSGDGLVAAGDLAESVWLDKGMDASALALSNALRVTRTVAGTEAALPRRPAEVGLVPEYALLPAFGSSDETTVLAGTDHTALLRFTWLPTAAAAVNPQRAVALSRLLAALAGPEAARAVASAGLRAAGGPAPARAPAYRLPRSGAAPFDVLQPHHVDHVFASWYPEDRRGSLLTVVDVSGSMADPAPGTTTSLIELVRQGCRAIEQLLPDDAYLGLWEFGSLLDPPRDYRILLPIGSLDAAQRRSLSLAVNGLAARRTGTGLYDTILAAYRTATAAYRPGMSNQVLVFTDGRNQDDAGTRTSADLTADLRAATDRQRPVLLTVVVFGSAAQAKDLGAALEPVGATVNAAESAQAVAAAFVHVAASGLHGE